MKRSVFVIPAVILIFAGNAFCGFPVSVSIDPENPTSSDEISVTLSGEWGDSCIPNDTISYTIGNDIYIYAFQNYPPGTFCYDICCPAWELTQHIGTLPAGSYCVHAGIFGYPEEVVKDFEVAPTIETNTYAFIPGDSNVVQTGGFAGITEVYSIKGEFQLTVNFDANIASFDRVDAQLFEWSPFISGYSTDLNELFDMTELVGTVVSDNEIEFDTADPMPGGKVVHLELVRSDGLVYLSGGYCEPWPDGFCFEMNAVARENLIFYVDGVDGNDLNDGLTPETAFATIQRGINSTVDGDTVMVMPADYNEIDFQGRNINVTSINPENSTVVSDTIIEGMVMFRGTEDANCNLSGFTITGGIHGLDWSFDPSGENHTHATISHCILEYNFTGCAPSIGNCDGLISNCIVTNPITICCLLQPAIGNCNGVIRNCTIYSNTFGILVHSGKCKIENTVIYPKEMMWRAVDIEGGKAEILYSNIPGGKEGVYVYKDAKLHWGPGNIDCDPCFVRTGYWDTNGIVPGDYHLKSQAGRWDPNNENWEIDSFTSCAIDKGNPGCPLGNEPEDVNNVRINMGAYGGTAEASKTPSNFGLLANLTNDGRVDSNDFEIFSNFWLKEGLCIPGDLDRSGFVDLFDYALFSGQWEYEAGGEPGITYEVGGCGEELNAASEADAARFSVKVDGQYIHFYAKVRANCCTNWIELQMTVEDNVITIFEIEHTTSYCLCLCDYPITARLGPFAVGTYRLDVYQGEVFIGDTTFEIK
jgi:hypothetical protein